MRIIARIPDLAAAPAATAPPRGPASPSPLRPPVARPRPRPSRFSSTAELALSWPVAALAMVAVLAWVLASWNEHSRLQRQRDGMRLAREPVAPTAGTDTENIGAFVR